MTVPNTESINAFFGRSEYLRRYQSRLDEFFTGDPFEDFVVGEARIFRRENWLEIGLKRDLNDGPYLVDLDKADTDEDLIAAEAWAVWMRILERDQTRELVVGSYRPGDTYETYTDPIGAICAPEWWSIKEANRRLFTSMFGSWVCFSESDRWALFCYCEGICVLGGTVGYMNEFRSLFGSFGRLRESFVAVNEMQLGPAWVNNDYRKLPGVIRWPPEENPRRAPSGRVEENANKSQALSAKKPRKATAATRGKPTKAKGTSAKKPRKAKQSQ